MVNQEEIREILHDALLLWWLRPENGLAIASYSVYGYDLVPEPGWRSADYACGDGVNTFFKCKGRFHPRFDVFRGGCIGADMLTIVQNHVDVFDYHDENYTPVIVKTPPATYTYGTDHKANLIKKAEKLNFYDHLIEADLRGNTAIEPESLQLVYCNSLYWIDEPASAVAFMVEKLVDGGKAVFDVFTANKRKLDFRVLYPAVSPYWQDLMNRGRIENNPGLRTESQWENIFRRCGLKIMEKREILPGGIARFWNYGLRPIFPVLNRMIEQIPEDKIVLIKEEWVATWVDLLLPVLESPDEFSEERTRYRLQYVLEK